MLENRVGRMTTAYEYLKSIGKAHKQQDVAVKMGTDKANVSRAMKGDEKYLTDRFLHRFNSAFDNIFNDEWLISGNGEMLAQDIHTQYAPTPNVLVDVDRAGYSEVSDANTCIASEPSSEHTIVSREQIEYLTKAVDAMEKNVNSLMKQNEMLVHMNELLTKNIEMVTKQLEVVLSDRGGK